MPFRAIQRSRVPATSVFARGAQLTRANVTCLHAVWAFCPAHGKADAFATANLTTLLKKMRRATLACHEHAGPADRAGISHARMRHDPVKERGPIGWVDLAGVCAGKEKCSSPPRPFVTLRIRPQSNIVSPRRPCGSNASMEKFLNNAAHWRRRAEQKRAKASSSFPYKDRDRLLKAAEEYDRLAERAERWHTPSDPAVFQRGAAVSSENSA